MDIIEQNQNILEAKSMSFGSPAADYHENKLDLNRYLVPHPVTTYFVKMDSNRLSSEGINPGDILVVDRSVFPGPGQLALIENHDGFQTVHYRRLPETEVRLFGAVTAVIRKL